nr:periplasmic beta-glucosidase precursor, putative [Tanacetum cinerariifolium]
NGIPATANKWLMTDLLRRQWGFLGFVATDYTAINELSAHGLGDDKKVSELALNAGIDMDMVGEIFLNNLAKNLKEGTVKQADVDLACRRVLEAKYRLGLFQDPYRGVSEERAKQLIKRLNEHGGQLDIDPRPADAQIAEAVAAAQKAEVVVAVVGESQGMTGEAASRADIGLPGRQLDLLKALKATGKPLVVVLCNGRPLTLPWENDNASAILETWFGGTQAGNAVADVLFGVYNPSGKITMTFPRSVGQVPIYYNHKNTGRPYAGVLLDKYKSRYLDAPNDPLYPFGFG